MRYIRRFFTLVVTALTAPILAASPLLAVAMIAYSTGSAAATLYTETFFELLPLAMATTLLVGLPLHAVLSVIRGRSVVHYALAGAVLAAAAWMLLPHMFGRGDELPLEAVLDPLSPQQWGTLLAYGALTGVLFRRRARAASAIFGGSR